MPLHANAHAHDDATERAIQAEHDEVMERLQRRSRAIEAECAEYREILRRRGMTQNEVSIIEHHR